MASQREVYFFSREQETRDVLDKMPDFSGKIFLLPENLDDIEDCFADIARDRLAVFTESSSYKLDQQMSALVGSSDKIMEVKDHIFKFGPAPDPVLITGESGTGKDITARLLHDFSKRNGRRFHAINAGSIPRGLSAAEFFGTAAGAYTGAVRRNGCFEHADGGSLFIDEIAELDYAIQADLLRVLETGDIRKIGSNEIKKVDVRLISATNKDLYTEADAGRFRIDLMYRIDMLRIHIPPLKDRKEDIPDLLLHFSNQLHKEQPEKHYDFAESFLDKLFEYHWPGNVRELRNIFRRAVYSSDSEMLDADSITFRY